MKTRTTERGMTPCCWLRMYYNGDGSRSRNVREPTAGRQEAGSHGGTLLDFGF
jgi:hypothetical protein